MSAQRRQRETWEHKARADSCRECHAVCGAVRCQACCAAVRARELGHSCHEGNKNVCEEGGEQYAAIRGVYSDD